MGQVAPAGPVARGGAGGAGGAGGEGGSGGTGGGGDTWSTTMQTFFATYCVECHQGGSSPEDFRNLDGVKAKAPMIRCGVAPVKESGCGASPAPKQFPIGSGPKPTDPERARVVAWIDAGMP